MLWTYLIKSQQKFETEKKVSKINRTDIDVQVYDGKFKFNITISLSKKGCPYDNTVAESLYHILKTEFVKKRKFDSLESLEIELFDYVNWYNNLRIHGSLNYMTPAEYRIADVN